eukprot:gene4491-115_t
MAAAAAAMVLLPAAVVALGATPRACARKQSSCCGKRLVCPVFSTCAAIVCLLGCVAAAACVGPILLSAIDGHPPVPDLRPLASALHAAVIPPAGPASPGAAGDAEFEALLGELAWSWQSGAKPALVAALGLSFSSASIGLMCLYLMVCYCIASKPPCWMTPLVLLAAVLGLASSTGATAWTFSQLHLCQDLDRAAGGLPSSLDSVPWLHCQEFAATGAAIQGLESFGSPLIPPSTSPSLCDFCADNALPCPGCCLLAGAASPSPCPPQLPGSPAMCTPCHNPSDSACGPPCRAFCQPSGFSSPYSHLDLSVMRTCPGLLSSPVGSQIRESCWSLHGDPFWVAARAGCVGLGVSSVLLVCLLSVCLPMAVALQHSQGRGTPRKGKQNSRQDAPFKGVMAYPEVDPGRHAKSGPDGASKRAKDRAGASPEQQGRPPLPRRDQPASAVQSPYRAPPRHSSAPGRAASHLPPQHDPQQRDPFADPSFALTPSEPTLFGTAAPTPAAHPAIQPDDRPWPGSASPRDAAPLLRNSPEGNINIDAMIPTVDVREVPTIPAGEPAPAPFPASVLVQPARLEPCTSGSSSSQAASDCAPVFGCFSQVRLDLCFSPRAHAALRQAGGVAIDPSNLVCTACELSFDNESALRSHLEDMDVPVAPQQGSASPCGGGHPEAEEDAEGQSVQDHEQTLAPDMTGPGSVSDGTLCIICMDSPPGVCLVPCGHIDFCRDCVDDHVQRNGYFCPQCRQPVDRVVTTFGG